MATKDQLTATELYALYRAIRRMAAHPIGEYNELSVLLFLRTNGVNRVTDIAKQQGLTQPGVTAILHRLEEHGDITRVPDDTDGRATLVDITVSGRQRLTRAEEETTVHLRQYLAQLGEAEHRLLHDAAPAFSRLIELMHDNQR